MAVRPLAVSVDRRRHWLRRPPHREPAPGDTVVETFVRARLLGLPVLTLEGRLVVVSDYLVDEGCRPLDLRFDQRSRPVSAPDVERPAVGERPRPGDLLRAQQLLERSARTLEEVREFCRA